jgi:hypothetical protein
MSELTDLAARVEAATGADRELDALIADAIGKGSWYASGNPAWKFTASLDAAMMLVPEGYAYGVGNINPSLPPKCRCNAWVMPPPYKIGADIRTGATPALALTAAALRALSR